MAFQSSTFPVCSGVISQTQSPQTGDMLLSCSQPWGQAAGILIDPAYQAQLELMLDHSGIDWNAVMTAFGVCMSLFITGAILGVYINLTRKVK